MNTPVSAPAALPIDDGRAAETRVRLVTLAVVTGTVLAAVLTFAGVEEARSALLFGSLLVGTFALDRRTRVG